MENHRKKHRKTGISGFNATEDGFVLGFIGMYDDIPSGTNIAMEHGTFVYDLSILSGEGFP